MIVTRGFDDILADRVVLALTTFLAEQLAECATDAERKAVKYTVSRDRTEPAGIKELPFVNIWTDSAMPESKGSTARTLSQEAVTLNVDMIAGYDPDSDDASVPSGPKARARLLYLKEQVRHALYRLTESDFGFDPGVISGKSWPTFTLYKDETGNPADSVVGGRWSLTVTYEWTPIPIEGVPLDEIKVDTGLFSSMYSL